MTIYRGTLEQVAALLFIGAGTFALLAAYRYWRRGTWRRTAVAAAALVALAAATLAAAYTVVPNLPAAPLWTRFAANPVPAAAEHVSAGRTTFQTKCAVCHGPRGRGDGPAAFAMVPRPLDLTVHVPLHGDGEIFWFISEGIGGTQMPAWKNDLTETERWQVVRYLRELAAGRP